jgi:hypothetical protein
MRNDLSGKKSLKVSTSGTRARLRCSCHLPLDAIDADWRQLAFFTS